MGTPVIAMRRGSVPEIIEHGVTGFVVDSEEEALAAIQRLPALDRAGVRAGFERRFTARRMAENYVGLYRRLGAASKGASSPPTLPTSRPCGHSAHEPR